jgi:hypothetical protein
MSRSRSQGSSRSSRTIFLKKEVEIISIALNPTWSIWAATGSIMSVRMAPAHRLMCPSRSVVSTKCTGFILSSTVLPQYLHLDDCRDGVRFKQLASCT